MRLSILACAVVLGAANASIEPTFAAQFDAPDANYVTNFNLGGDDVGPSSDGDGGDSGVAGDGGNGSAEGGQGDENSDSDNGDAGGSNDGDGEGNQGGDEG